MSPLPFSFHPFTRKICNLKLHAIVRPIVLNKPVRQPLFLGILLFSTLSVFAQNKGIDRSGERTTNENSQSFDAVNGSNNYVSTSSPLTNNSFNKMMSSEYRNIILGTQSPVSGFKLETVNPSITLSGNIFSDKYRNYITTLELSAGVKNNISSLFANQKLNGGFKAVVGFNIMVSQLQRAKYNISIPEKVIKHQRIERYATGLINSIDTAIIYGILLGDRKSLVTFQNVADKVIREKTAFYGVVRPGTTVNGDATRAMTVAILKILSPSESENLDDQLTALQDRLEDVEGDMSKIDTPFDRYTKIKSFRESFQNLVDDSCINTFKHIWRSKTIWWMNISPSIGNTSLSMYDTLNKKINEKQSLLYGVQLSVNRLHRYANGNRIFYLKAGLEIARVNNLSDMSTLDFKSVQALSANGGVELTTEKTGTAYKGSIVHDLGITAFTECYLTFFNNQYVPGLYVKSMLTHSHAWFNSDKLALDLGMLWNLSNADKTKTIVSVIPFVSWSNLIKQYKDVKKVETTSLGDLFSVGLKFGIPVNLTAN